MVFANDKQRRGFFANVKANIEARSERRQQAVQNQLIAERQRLQVLQQKQAVTIQQRKIVLQQEKTVNDQRKEIIRIKDEEKAIKKELFEASTVGKTLRAGQVIGGKLAKSKLFK